MFGCELTNIGPTNYSAIMAIARHYTHARTHGGNARSDTNTYKHRYRPTHAISCSCTNNTFKKTHTLGSPWISTMSNYPQLYFFLIKRYTTITIYTTVPLCKTIICRPTTKIEALSVHHIPETVSVRTMKLAHRPRIERSNSFQNQVYCPFYKLY